jgi:catechol 2,3-dioxygenase-like lactoylglutathione lyase family enzyme
MEGFMKRIQLAINVSDLDEAVDFYSKFFDSVPAKKRPGYANFAIDQPPLKLVLIENGGESGSINHLGVEVFSPQEVAQANQDLLSKGFVTDIENQTTCCYAVQDKVWVDGPDKSRWEIYTVLSDATDSDSVAGDNSCCASASTGELEDAVPAPACC